MSIFDDDDSEPERAQKRKKKKKIELRGRLTDTTNNIEIEEIIPKKYAIGLKVTQIIVNFIAVLFFITIAVGGLIHFSQILLGKTEGGIVPPLSGPIIEEVDWKEAKEAALLAFVTSWRAFRLWFRLFVSFVIPTSHATFVITKEGFIAMQPSFLATLQFLLELPPMVKLGIGLTITLGLVVFLVVEEAKKLRITDKFTETYHTGVDYVVYKYQKFVTNVTKRSRIVGTVIPHVLFTTTAFGLSHFFPTYVADFSRGVGGWMLVIGVPVALSTRALTLYDQKYIERIQKVLLINRKTSKRRMSELPKFETDASRNIRQRGASYIETFFDAVKRPFVPETKEEKLKDKDKDEVSEDEMRPYLTLNNRKNYKTMRGIRRLEYPGVLDTDDNSAKEQAAEVSTVINWLKYWLILGFALVLEQLPLTGHVLAVIPVWPPLRMMFSIWLYAPFTEGAKLAFKIAIPLISKYWQKIELLTPASGGGASAGIMSQLVLSQLPLSQKNKKYISEIGETGSTLLLSAAPFFFLPSFLNTIGIVLIGLARPMYAGFVSVLSFETAKTNLTVRNLSKNKDDKATVAIRKKLLKRMNSEQRKSNATVASTCLHCTTWLEYWVVYAVAMFILGALSIFLNFMPFANQFQLGVLLWLQLPYFRGARQVFKELLKRYYSFKRRFISKPKKKKRERARLGRVDGKKGNVVKKLENVAFLPDSDDSSIQSNLSGLELAEAAEETTAPPSPIRS